MDPETDPEKVDYTRTRVWGETWPGREVGDGSEIVLRLGSTMGARKRRPRNSVLQLQFAQCLGWLQSGRTPCGDCAR